MIAAIQSSPGRRPRAGHMKTRDGRRILFVADPEQAPSEPGVLHARPDSLSHFGAPWRNLLQSYNANPRGNPLGLLPACEFYPDEVYTRLVAQLGAKKTYILSPGWGLVKSSFLLPDYDITLSPGAEPFRRRGAEDVFADFCMLPGSSDEDLYFFGGEEYVPLFCRLTAAYKGRRIVYHAADTPPEAPGCALRKFEAGAEADWLRECVNAFLSGRSRLRSEESAPKVAHIESRLRQTLKKFSHVSGVLADDNPQLDEAAVRAAVREAREEIAEFLWLAQAARGRVAENSEFQQRFNAFHRVTQRSQAWHAAFYRLLETTSIVGADFADVLHTLWDQTGRFEPGLASRLVATVDPDQPTWDRFALMNAGQRAPAYLDPDKLQKAVTVYRQINDWYASRLAMPAGQRMIELFNEEAPEHRAISAIKKLEFVLRHTRVADSGFALAGHAGASGKRPA